MSRRACYPRPDFRRETWMSLNGAWRFSFGDEEKDRMDQPPTLSQMPLTIEVPYVYQSELSGIGQTEATTSSGMEKPSACRIALTSGHT